MPFGLSPPPVRFPEAENPGASSCLIGQLCPPFPGRETILYPFCERSRAWAGPLAPRHSRHGVGRPRRLSGKPS